MASITKTRKSTKSELHCIARIQLHANMDTVKYGIQSGEKRYVVTLYKGRATACEHNGESCPSYKFRGTCKHAERALALECERTAELAEAAIIESSELPEMAAHQDVEQHVADSIRAGSLSWAEQQRVARAEMTPDEREAQLLMLGARRWMAA